tara:strand:- start:132 stop:344 length:213 start_codon:yes stop_codon:yes gene_type:complete
MSHIKGKLRNINSSIGRKTGHMERTNMNVYNHVQSLRHDDMENQIKKINQMVADGDVSKETGKFLKKQVQ